MGTPRHCSPEASFRRKRRETKKKNICLEKIGIPEGVNATVREMSARYNAKDKIVVRICTYMCRGNPDKMRSQEEPWKTMKSLKNKKSHAETILASPTVDVIPS